MKETNRTVNWNTISIILAFFAGSFLMYMVVYYYPISTEEVINKLEKEVTITDTGIADAVDKLYDAVVVISAYKNDEAISGGTGFVYKTDDDYGYIITNNHVINGATKVVVTLTNGTEIESTIVGSDVFSDIAVLSILKEDVLLVADIGNNKETRLGDTAFSIGAPISETYNWSVTRGIISGKDRLVEVSLSNTSNQDIIMKVIQTDTALNNGNSGGPLANSNGEVIGVTNMKLVSTNVDGVAFAIPIEDAVLYADKLIKNKSIDRPYLGIALCDVTDQYCMYANELKSSASSGLIVAVVEDSSSAKKAGIKVNDIIQSIDDKTISSVAEFRYELYKHNVGDTIELGLIKDGSIKKIKVTLAKQ